MISFKYPKLGWKGNSSNSLFFFVYYRYSKNTYIQTVLLVGLSIPFEFATEELLTVS